MARLETYKCPKHGDVWAPDHRYGPCGKCESEALKARMDKAMGDIAAFADDGTLILRAEIEVLRGMLVKSDKALAAYWEAVAEYLRKNEERKFEYAKLIERRHRRT